MSAEADKSVNFIVKKGNSDKVESKTTIDEPLRAPIKKGQKIGEATLSVGGEKLAKCDIKATTEVKRMNAIAMYVRLLQKMLCM